MKKIILSLLILTSVQSYAAGFFDNVPVYRVYGKEVANNPADIQVEVVKCDKELSAKATELKQLKMTILKINNCSAPPPLIINGVPQDKTSVNGSISFIK